MTKEEVIAHFGSRIKAAKALGIDNSTITRWKRVPRWHQTNAETLSNGKLKADKVKPKVRNATNTSKVCFTVPTESLKNFKKYCQDHEYSMSEKISELIDWELSLS